MNPEGVRKTLDSLAYVSLALDVCIAVITGLTVLDAQLTKRLLLPANYVLSAVVVLSVALFFVLIVLKAKEKRSLGREDAAGARSRVTREPGRGPFSEVLGAEAKGPGTLSLPTCRRQ